MRKYILLSVLFGASLFASNEMRGEGRFSESPYFIKEYQNISPKILLRNTITDLAIYQREYIHKHSLFEKEEQENSEMIQLIQKIIPLLEKERDDLFLNN